MLAPDATTLAYLEGPDTSGRTGAGGTLVGGWVLVVQDQRTGKETVRVKLAPPADAVGLVRLDFDGRWAVVSQSEGGSVRAIDTIGNDPRVIELEDVRGIASFELT